MLSLVGLGKNYSLQEYSNDKKCSLKSRSHSNVNCPHRVTCGHCTIKVLFCRENMSQLGKALPGSHKVYYIWEFISMHFVVLKITLSCSPF